MATLDKPSPEAALALLMFNKRADDLVFAATMLMASAGMHQRTDETGETLLGDVDDALSIAYGLQERIRAYVKAQL